MGRERAGGRDGGTVGVMVGREEWAGDTWDSAPPAPWTFDRCSIDFSEKHSGDDEHPTIPNCNGCQGCPGYGGECASIWSRPKQE